VSAHLQEKKIPILMYHSISTEATPQFRPFTVPPTLFADHMMYLYQHGYMPLSVSQFIQRNCRPECMLPELPVVITFDDGFADFFTHALPVLRKYDFAATLYVTTGYINETSRWLRREHEMARPMLTWEQLREISANGIECGAHSHSHPQMDMLSPLMAQKEIAQSKAFLEEHLGHAVASFAYPYGYFTATVRRMVQEAGFTSACAVKFAMSSMTSDPFALARLIIKPETSVEALAALLQGQSISPIATMYARARTPVWRFVRRGSSYMFARPALEGKNI
jgi:peptidoglycan/xylan/chitin deacetylase (PgdA/CDA1 family)